jgi:hypothetical protein
MDSNKIKNASVMTSSSCFLLQVLWPSHFFSQNTQNFASTLRSFCVPQLAVRPTANTVKVTTFPQKRVTVSVYVHDSTWQRLFKTFYLPRPSLVVRYLRVHLKHTTYDRSAYLRIFKRQSALLHKDTCQRNNLCTIIAYFNHQHKSSYS